MQVRTNVGHLNNSDEKMDGKRVHKVQPKFFNKEIFLPFFVLLESVACSVEEGVWKMLVC